MLAVDLRAISWVVEVLEVASISYSGLDWFGFHAVGKDRQHAAAERNVFDILGRFRRSVLCHRRGRLLRRSRI